MAGRQHRPRSTHLWVVHRVRAQSDIYECLVDTAVWSKEVTVTTNWITRAKLESRTNKCEDLSTVYCDSHLCNERTDEHVDIAYAALYTCIIAR